VSKYPTHGWLWCSVHKLPVQQIAGRCFFYPASNVPCELHVLWAEVAVWDDTAPVVTPKAVTPEVQP
jgi:hypothetical protein